MITIQRHISAQNPATSILSFRKNGFADTKLLKQVLRQQYEQPRDHDARREVEPTGAVAEMTPAIAFPLLERHTDCVAALVVIESLVLAIAAQLFHCALSILAD